METIADISSEVLDFAASTTHDEQKVQYDNQDLRKRDLSNTAQVNIHIDAWHTHKVQEIFTAEVGEEEECASGYYDCEGICDGAAVEDCLGECGGDAVVDYCDECGGSNDCLGFAGMDSVSTQITSSGGNGINVADQVSVNCLEEVYIYIESIDDYVWGTQYCCDSGPEDSDPYHFFLQIVQSSSPTW